jgi:hypothetical protein
LVFPVCFESLALKRQENGHFRSELGGLMIVTDMPVESLVPYARNPRNNTAAIDAVKASIAEFGFRQPIVVDEKMVVTGGGVVEEAMAAKFWPVSEMAKY